MHYVSGQSSAMECYHGKLSSSQAEERLKAAGAEGAYLVRESIVQGGASLSSPG